MTKDKANLQRTTTSDVTLGAVVRRVSDSTAEDVNADTFDLSDQPAGLYLVQVQTATGLRTLRIIKN